MLPRIIKNQPLNGLFVLFPKEKRINGSFSFESFNALKPSLNMKIAPRPQNEIINKNL